jgi:hypothetical protein
MDPVYYPDAYAATLRGIVGPISLIGVFAAPLGWLLAGIAIWRRLPHVFAILARWFVAVHGAAGALLLFGLISALSSGQSLAENAWGLGFFAASVSGLLSWVVVGRRSRGEERMPSLS